MYEGMRRIRRRLDTELVELWGRQERLRNHWRRRDAHPVSVGVVKSMMIRRRGTSDERAYCGISIAVSNWNLHKAQDDGKCHKNHKKSGRNKKELIRAENVPFSSCSFSCWLHSLRVGIDVVSWVVVRHILCLDRQPKYNNNAGAYNVQ